MRVNVAIPEEHVDQHVLNAALESVTRLNEQMLEAGQVPTFDKALSKGVKWKPEPPGQEHFDHAKLVVQRGWGDCDDLAPYHAASLRATGEDPGADAVVYKSGPKRWHAVVRRSDGSIDDPSKAAGMGRVQGVVGAVVPQIHGLASQVVGAFEIRPSIAMTPIRGGWKSRVDVPWNFKEHQDDKPTPLDWSMAVLHASPMAATSLVGAIDGAIELARCTGCAEHDHLCRLGALADCAEGMELDELCEKWGPEHAHAAVHVVGSLFSKITRGVRNVAKSALKVATLPTHLAAKVLVHVPGIGPIAASTIELANRAAHGDLSAIADIAKSPIGKSLISMVPGIGPVASEALQIATSKLRKNPRLFAELATHGGEFPSAFETDPMFA